jgi:hypothetical protein
LPPWPFREHRQLLGKELPKIMASEDTGAKGKKGIVSIVVSITVKEHLAKRRLAYMVSKSESRIIVGIT